MLTVIKIHSLSPNANRNKNIRQQILNNDEEKGLTLIIIAEVTNEFIMKSQTSH